MSREQIDEKILNARVVFGLAAQGHIPSSPIINPVYVDPLMNCMISAAWKWPRSCHMFVEPGTDLEVLHQFAERVGLKRKWFQNKQGKCPHYDLHEARHKVAVKLGAVELDRRAAVEIIRKWKGR